MKKTIAVFTGTRAEYGLLVPLLNQIQQDPALTLRLLVTGTHLSTEFGHTWKQIEDDGFSVDEKIEILLSSDTAVGVAKSMGVGILGFADALARSPAESIIILGDRFEALAMAQTALILRIPVIHLHGGEITEGAYDDAIRHAITKLSYLHFTSTEEHRRRVIQLGEHPNRVFNVGAIGLDKILNTDVMCFDALNHSMANRINNPYLLITYHPVTLAEEEEPEKTFKNIIAALNQLNEYQVIVTYPNADNGGRRIISLIQQWSQDQPQKVIVIPSLGYQRYLSAVKYSSVVVGNSSSGLIEVPSLNVATVNIGCRQKGRTAANSVIHCTTAVADIANAIRHAIEKTAKLKTTPVINPYGNGNTAKKIISILKKNRFIKTKQFYDII